MAKAPHRARGSSAARHCPRPGHKPSTPRNTSIDTSSIRRDAARDAAAAITGDDAAAGRQIPARDGGRRAAVAERRARRASGEETVAGVPRALAAATEGVGRDAGRRGAARRRRLRRGVRGDSRRRRGARLPYGVAGTAEACAVLAAMAPRAPAGARRPATVAFARRRGPRSQRRRSCCAAARRAGDPRRRSYTRRIWRQTAGLRRGRA